jgi:hypothetical protein
MKSGENYNFFSRRKFLKLGVASVVLAYIPKVLVSCKNDVLKFLFRVTGANHILGHRLWTKDFPNPIKNIEIPVIIVGGGVSGLSAGRQLIKKGVNDFLILELENKVGGNSANGENKYSKYPLAAHYLPLPNPEDKELIEFLKDSKIITDFEKDLSVFDEEQLCADPKERLFIHNIWQEDLVPKFGNSAKTEAEFRRFFEWTYKLTEEKDSRGKYYFTIPIKDVSDNKKYRYLDRMTMKQWLVENNYSSEELYEYINYCCRDDFGLGIEAVSAWAGHFYFCARKNKIYKSDAVLTWPEGNGRLVSHLKSTFRDKIKSEVLVYNIELQNDKVNILAFDVKNNQSICYKADKVICAIPQFVSQYLIKGRKKIASKFEYAPWFTATIILNDAFYNDTFPLSWDNVIYKTKGLGYVYNQHQQVAQIQNQKVITYYYSFSEASIKENRKKLFKMKDEEFKRIVIDDLSIAHPNIEENIIEIEVYKLGHGMISPKPNFLFSNELKEARQSIDDRIIFAHSDLSGVSIFEEAFHQGIDAANSI